MTHQHSIIALVFGLLSSTLAGCGGASAGGPGAAGEKDADGYGYEMKPLTLSAAPAPAGDALMANGRVAPEEIVRQATAKIPELRQCHAAALEKTPGMSATVVVRMRFEAAGGPAGSSKVQDPQPADAALGECVAKVLGAISVPATKDGPLEVVYPVELAPEAAK